MISRRSDVSLWQLWPVQAAFLVVAAYVTYRLGSTVAVGGWQALLLPLGAAAVLVVLRRPHLGLYLILISVLFMPTNVDQLPGPRVADSVAEWLFYATMLGATVQALGRRQLPFRLGTLGIPLGLFLAVTLIQAVRPGELGSTLLFTLAFLVPAMMYFMTITFVRSASQLDRLVLALMCVLLVFFAIRLYFWLPSIMSPFEAFGRVGASNNPTLADWGISGKKVIWMANMVVPWALVLAVAHPKRQVRRLGLMTSAAAMITSTTSTFRLGIISVVLGLLAALVSARALSPSNRRRLWGLSAVLVTLAVFVITVTPVAAELKKRFGEEFPLGAGPRVSLYERDLSRFASSPVVGGGIHAGSNHSYFLTTLANWGLFVGVPMVWLWGCLTVDRYALWRRARSPGLKAIGAAGLAALVPTIVDATLDGSFLGVLGGSYRFVFWILCGIVTVSLRLVEQESNTQRAG